MTKTNELDEMCIEIFACAHLGCEVTLSGNGINASEASGVAWAVLDVLHGDGRTWQKDNGARIAQRAKQIAEDYGLDD